MIKEGDSISDAKQWNEALNADAVLFGAVGGSKWDNVPRDKSDLKLRFIKIKKRS